MRLLRCCTRKAQGKRTTSNANRQMQSTHLTVCSSSLIRFHAGPPMTMPNVAMRSATTHSICSCVRRSSAPYKTQYRLASERTLETIHNRVQKTRDTTLTSSGMLYAPVLVCCASKTKRSSCMENDACANKSTPNVNTIA